MPELIGATVVAMLAISGIALLLFPRGARVPMQWDLRGQPTWAAPKVIGVLFSPALALLVLSFTAYSSANEPQKIASVLSLIAGAFLVFHVLHLVLAQWHFNANKS